MSLDPTGTLTDEQYTAQANQLEANRAQFGSQPRYGGAQVAYDQSQGGWGYYETNGYGYPVWRPVNEGASPDLVGGSALASADMASGLKDTGANNLAMYAGLARGMQTQQGQYATAAQGLGQRAFVAGQGATNDLGLIQERTLQAATPGTVDARLGDSYSRLLSYASQGPGPSAAQAQLDAALGQNVAAQFSLASSGRNAGQNAMAMRGAAATAADLGARTAAEKASLRAQEEAAWRQSQLQAITGASGVAGTIEQAQQARSGQSLQALAQAAGNQGNAYTQTMGNYGALTDANKTAAGITSAANGMTLQASQAGTTSQAGYDQAALDIYTGNANRQSATAGQERSIAASDAAAAALRSERDTDRLVGAAGSAAQIGATVYGGG